MTEPTTLRAMAGAPTTPPPLAQTAVVVIDAQREYLDGAVPLPGIAPALDAIEQVLAAARAAGAPVIHVAHQGKPGALFDPEAGGAIIDRVAPAEGEVVVGKGLPNAFAGTTLREELAAVGDPHVVLVGFMTHMCISSTARAALDLGLATTVVADACATRDLPDPTGGSAIGHDQLHAAALAELADRFSVVTTAAALTG